MKTKRILALVLVLALSLCLLASCGGGGPKKEELVGTWSSSWIYNGKAIGSAFTLNADGTYSSTTVTDGEISSQVTGTWTLSGKTVELNPDDHISYLKYKYSDGNLINGDHTFKKAEF